MDKKLLDWYYRVRQAEADLEAEYNERKRRIETRNEKWMKNNG